MFLHRSPLSTCVQHLQLIFMITQSSFIYSIKVQITTCTLNMYVNMHCMCIFGEECHKHLKCVRTNKILMSDLGATTLIVCVHLGSWTYIWMVEDRAVIVYEKLLSLPAFPGTI